MIEDPFEHGRGRLKHEIDGTRRGTGASGECCDLDACELELPSLNGEAE